MPWGTGRGRRGTSLIPGKFQAVRRRVLTLTAVLLVAPACGDGGSGETDAPSDGEATASPGDGTRPGGDLEGDISIESTAFEFEGAIPERYGLDEGNVSPPLTWDVTVAGAAELVLLVDDPDAPGEDPFVHWMVAGLDPGSTGIEEGKVPAGAVEGETDFGDVGYGGPAPPGGETHRYVFKLIALDAPSGLEEGFSRDDLEGVLDERFLVSAEYAGLFTG